MRAGIVPYADRRRDVAGRCESVGVLNPLRVAADAQEAKKAAAVFKTAGNAAFSAAKCVSPRSLGYLTLAHAILLSFAYRPSALPLIYSHYYQSDLVLVAHSTHNSV